MTHTAAPRTDPSAQDAVLDEISRRVLWLATSIVDAANNGRHDPSGLKVGGHQASSASLVSIMTSLWFDELTAADRVSVKPHASPVLHAVNHLLGDLDAAHLTTLRQRGGLQSYPSRTKDPDTVDFSTGSVGIGATATVWAALAHRYLRSRYADTPAAGRWIALLGDAELDEGAIWEAVADPMVSQVGELLWVVDLNRQSLDRVVPDIAIQRLQGMFDAAGWQVLTCKWGRRISALFAADGGDQLQRRLEDMPNEEYQRLLRSPSEALAQRIAGPSPSSGLRDLLDGLAPDDLAAAVRDLGGHDQGLLRDTWADVDPTRPTVVFAYTIKGWGLPTEGHPANHSALLTPAQMGDLAQRLGADAADPWRPLPAGPASDLCARRGLELRRPPVVAREVAPPPATLGLSHTGHGSTQAAFGRFLLDLRRAAPDVADRVVTLSPDVASSTNLGGWINATGVWSVGERHDWFADDAGRLVQWSEVTSGQHIELGIAETNLVGLLGELGTTWSRTGQPLLPIATIYDPFVSRCLEPWSFGIYAGGQSILVGTPSGVTLAAEGGAHQSITTASIGLEQPGCTAYEPAFAQDLEWTMLAALAEVGRPGGSSAYLRLSTRPVEQRLADVPTSIADLEVRRAHCVAGGYRLRSAPDEQVTLVGMGAVMTEVLGAADRLAELGVAAGVVCVTSPDLLFRDLQGRSGLSGGRSTGVLAELFPPGRPLPLVTALDAHPHTLAFLAGVRGDPTACLGVSSFGQSSDLADAYALHGLDVDTLVGAALDLLDV